MIEQTDGVQLNGVRYCWPRRTVVVVCIDGGDPEYFDSGRSRGILPHIDGLMRDGFSATAQGTMPSFTCPNNMSLATGAPPAIHGVSGNFHLDRASGQAVPMTGPEMLRTRSVLAEFAQHGARVVCITAKDKLRAQLGKEMPIESGRAVNFSAQCADQCTLETHGITDVLELLNRQLPDMYSADLSLFVLDAGIRLLQTVRPHLAYLSLTDFIQHAYAPGHPLADQFYAELDDRVGQLLQTGAVVALTADHGMSDMSCEDGAPRVVWLQEELDRAFGAKSMTVICPITDAFVGHHGALGGFVRVYKHRAVDEDRVIDFISHLEGVAQVWSRAQAAHDLELPFDVEADYAVMGEEGTALGVRPEAHDIAALRGQRLRSHGSIWEAQVPFLISEPLQPQYAARAMRGPLKSHQIFDYAINGTQE